MEEQALGETQLWRFASTFGEAAATLLACGHWVTYIVGPELRIKHFLAGTTDAAEQADYESRYMDLDPLSPRHCLSEGRRVACLSELLAPDQAAHRAYREDFLERYAIVDALEIFLQSDAGLTLGCSLLRHGTAPRFTAQERDKAEALRRLGDFALSQTFPRRQASIEVIAERFPLLTPRETMLIQLVSAGLNNKQLCRELGISLPTVKSHLLSIFRKMEVANRTELAAKVLC